jgi:hypothetical protein
LTVAYTLTAPAAVTATLTSGTGQVVEQLGTVHEPAGSWTLTYVPPAGTADGAYAIALTATDGSRIAAASAPFVLDDILTGLLVAPGSATFSLTRPAQLVTAQITNGAHVVAAPAVLATSGSQTVTWPALPPGSYTLTLTITDDVGTFSRTAAFTSG